jgi:hypothetical protein
MANKEFRIPREFSMADHQNIYKKTKTLLEEPFYWSGDLSIHEFNETGNIVTVAYNSILCKFYGGHIAGDKKNIMKTANRLGLENYIVEAEE